MEMVLFLILHMTKTTEECTLTEYATLLLLLFTATLSIHIKTEILLPAKGQEYNPSLITMCF